jgi:hypothetical protein
MYLYPSFATLSNRWASHKREIRLIKEQFLAGHGSGYLYEKLQRLLEEYDQLDHLLIEILALDKKMSRRAGKRLAA